MAKRTGGEEVPTDTGESLGAQTSVYESGHTGVVRMESERSYFMRRAAQERSAATQAADETARKAHLEMAERYRKRVQENGIAVDQLRSS